MDNRGDWRADAKHGKTLQRQKSSKLQRLAILEQYFCSLTYVDNMRVLINYAQSDRSVVEQIAAFLPAENHDVSSEEQLLPTNDWAAKLGEQINAADAVIYAISPASLAS